MAERECVADQPQVEFRNDSGFNKPFLHVWRRILLRQTLERFKKFCSRSERGFLGFGEASAKTHARSGLQLSRNKAKTQKDRFFLSPPEWLQHFLNRSSGQKSIFCSAFSRGHSSSLCVFALIPARCQTTHPLLISILPPEASIAPPENHPSETAMLAAPHYSIG